MKVRSSLWRLINLLKNPRFPAVTLPFFSLINLIMNHDLAEWAPSDDRFIVKSRVNIWPDKWIAEKKFDLILLRKHIRPSSV